MYISDVTPAINPYSLQEKTAYKAWKSNRDALIGRGEEAIKKARFAPMASLAASFGKRRAQENKDDSRTVGTQDERDFKQEKKQKDWENVAKMEQEWTRRLIRGVYPPWAKKTYDEDNEG